MLNASTIFEEEIFGGPHEGALRSPIVPRLLDLSNGCHKATQKLFYGSGKRKNENYPTGVSRDGRSLVPKLATGAFALLESVCRPMESLGGGGKGGGGRSAFRSDEECLSEAVRTCSCTRQARVQFCCFCFHLHPFSRNRSLLQ